LERGLVGVLDAIGLNAFFAAAEVALVSVRRSRLRQLAEQGSAAPETAGEIVTTEGEVVGAHAGVHQFTVGQRRGLGLATGEPMYVVRIEPDSRRLVVGENRQLLRGTCEVNDVNWIAIERLEAPMRAEVKIRHKHEPAAAWIEPIEGASAAARVRVRFDEPQRAITPGQAAVFYEGERVLGGGWIL
jgi:tRNA-specific 2-thiouridylase